MDFSRQSLSLTCSFPIRLGQTGQPVIPRVPPAVIPSAFKIFSLRISQTYMHFEHIHPHSSDPIPLGHPIPVISFPPSCLPCPFNFGLVHRCGAIHQSKSQLPGAKPLKKNDSLSPCSHQLRQLLSQEWDLLCPDSSIHSYGYPYKTSSKPSWSACLAGCLFSLGFLAELCPQPQELPSDVLSRVAIFFHTMHKGILKNKNKNKPHGVGADC